MANDWTSELDWLPHEKGLARWAAARWGWKASDEDWPSSLALLVASEDEGHTALDWSDAAPLAARRFAGRSVDLPVFPGPDRWPRELFEDRWLMRRRIETGTLVQTQRNFLLENKLHSDLLKLAQASGSGPGGTDAVSRAGQARLLILVGGPGTGKTYTVQRLTNEWARLRPGLRVVIAAPTGRAAARAKESFGGQQPIPECLTLHRLLGLKPGLGKPWHGPSRPLPFDLVVVDEASMLDLRTGVALVEALAPQAALVLVGDPGQLPSVDAGSVLADLLKRPEFESNVVRLTVRHRLNPESLRLARVFDLLQSPIAEVELTVDRLAELGNGDHKDFVWIQTKEGEDPGPKGLAAWGSAQDLEVHTLSDKILLSPVHQGPGGTLALSGLADRSLRRPAGTIEAGAPWMIVRNLPHLDLHNGDRGLVTRRGNQLWFVMPGPPLKELPFNLVREDGQQAWAISVHKSQGSEFGRVVLVLPPTETPGLVRQLVYTGLTRAKTSAILVGSRAAIVRALSRDADRTSAFGLASEPEL